MIGKSFCPKHRIPSKNQTSLRNLERTFRLSDIPGGKVPVVARATPLLGGLGPLD